VTATIAPVPSATQLIRLAIPALVIGVVSAVVLWLLDVSSEVLEHWIWSTVPAALGTSGDEWWWILGILTLTGAAVGLVVWRAPGNGGQDSATVELFAPLLSLRALPGVALVIILGLAGGVSLGPESPIIAINTAIAVSLLARMWPRVPVELSVIMTAAGTVGAMFGTPVAAALVLTGMVAAVKGGGALWDKLFLPLVSAGAGSITMVLLADGSMAVKVPAYGTPHLIDLVTGSIVAGVAAVFAVLGVLAFPHVHRFFHGMRHPVLYLTLGGFALGLLGILGGPLTLFKGLHQMNDLVDGRADYGVWQLVILAVVKLAALVVAASAGFRGGRIFPAVFIGVSLGLIGHALIPTLPVGLSIACAVLGVVLVVSRDGWLSLFLAVAVAGDIAILPLLCIIVLPTWLIVKAAPEMIIHSPKLR
jgi:H+/Cl- antiporter ClcA